MSFSAYSCTFGCMYMLLSLHPVPSRDPEGWMEGRGREGGREGGKEGGKEEGKGEPRTVSSRVAVA